MINSMQWPLGLDLFMHNCIGLFKKFSYILVNHKTTGLFNGPIDRHCDKADLAKVVNLRSEKISAELLLKEAQALMLVCQVEVRHRRQAYNKTGTMAYVGELLQDST